MEAEETLAEAEAQEDLMTNNDFNGNHITRIFEVILLFIFCMYIVEKGGCSSCVFPIPTDAEVMNSLTPPVTVVTVTPAIKGSTDTKVLLRDSTGKVVTLVDRIFDNVKPGDVIR